MFWLSVFQKLSNLVEIRQVLTKTSWAIFGTPCTVTLQQPM